MILIFFPLSIIFYMLCASARSERKKFEKSLGVFSGFSRGFDLIRNLCLKMSATFEFFVISHLTDCRFLSVKPEF